MRHFDFAGYHPNWTGIKQRAGGVTGWIRYLTKEDEHPLTSYSADELKAICDGTGHKRSHDDAFLDALAADTADAAYDSLLRSLPAHTVTNSDRIKAGLEDAFARKVPESITLYADPIILPDGWNPLTHSLLVWGSPRVGKTQWAKTYCAQYWGDFLFIRSVHDLRELRAHHRAIIFDDLDFSKFSDSESKNLCEVAESCTVRVLYGAKRIRPDIVKIFTANKIDIFEDEFGAIYETRLKTWEFDQ